MPLTTRTQGVMPLVAAMAEGEGEAALKVVEAMAEEEAREVGEVQFNRPVHTNRHHNLEQKPARGKLYFAVSAIIPNIVLATVPKL